MPQDLHALIELLVMDACMRFQMSNSHDNTVYCLPHAVELLTHKRSQVKHCTLVYSFSEVRPF